MLALALLVLGCSGPKPPDAAPAEDTVPEMVATVRIDPDPGAKRFQGVWLDREGEEPLLIDYRAREFWIPFEGEQVTVTGEAWTPAPRAQQVDAAHFRVATLSLQHPTPEVALHAIGPEQTLIGLVETLEGEPGTKMEGSTWDAFAVEGGTNYQIWYAPEGMPKDTRLTITAREVTPSPFSAHMPGPTLWIGDFSAAD